jgi:hypothetical protein
MSATGAYFFTRNLYDTQTVNDFRKSANGFFAKHQNVHAAYLAANLFLRTAADFFVVTHVSTVLAASYCLAKIVFLPVEGHCNPKASIPNLVGVAVLSLALTSNGLPALISKAALATWPQFGIALAKVVPALVWGYSVIGYALDTAYPSKPGSGSPLERLKNNIGSTS